MEEKIIFMYEKGMTISDIEGHFKDLYGIDVPDSTISRITDKILPIVKEWQERLLESIYAVVFMNAIHFHVRSEGRIIKKPVYILAIHNECTKKSWSRIYSDSMCRQLKRYLCDHSLQNKSNGQRDTSPLTFNIKKGRE